MLRALVETLDEQLSEASSRPRERREVQRYAEEEDEPFGGEAAGGDQPCAKAVFEFDAENEGELSFPEVGERLPPPPFGCCRCCHCAVQPLGLPLRCPAFGSVIVLSSLWVTSFLYRVSFSPVCTFTFSTVQLSYT